MNILRKQKEGRKRDRNYEDECCTKKQKKLPPAYLNLRPVAKNNFFAPLKDLTIENVEPGS
jgi:hypothetical protein